MDTIAEETGATKLNRISGLAGISGAILTFVFGILHPKGTSDVGSVTEWMTRVHASDVWIVVHFALAIASVLVLISLVGIARTYTEQDAEAWARVGIIVASVATAVAVTTFLVDGAVVKQIADVWATDPDNLANVGAARFATEFGFILVAGLQMTIGMTALLFGLAGLRSDYPKSLAWLALATAVIGIVPGSASYIWGESTWSTSATYVSNGLFGIWILLMSRLLWRRAASA